RDPGVIYCGVTFKAPFCNGGVHDVFMPEQYNNLATALTRMMKREPASISFGGMDGCFNLDGAWNDEEQVAVFKISMPARLNLGDWCLWDEPSYYRGSMKTSIELEFWMEPAALEEPLAEVEAVLEHIRALRDAFRVQGNTFDPDMNRWD